MQWCVVVPERDFCISCALTHWHWHPQPPALRALLGAQLQWTFTFGDGSGPWNGAFVDELIVCGGSAAAVALIFPPNPSDGPPVLLWYLLVALDVSHGGGQPPGAPLWVANLTRSSVLPPSRVSMVCADSADPSSGGSTAVLTWESYTGRVTRFDVETGADYASALSTVPSPLEPCALTSDGLLLACASEDLTTGGVVGVGAGAGSEPPVRLWSAQSRGWAANGSLTSGIVVDDASGTLVLTTTAATIGVASKSGALLWSNPDFPGSNRPMASQIVRTAVPRAPNPLRIVYLAIDLDYGESRGYVAALDVDTGAILAASVSPGFFSLTSVNVAVAGGTGEDLLLVQWVVSTSSTAVFHVHLDLLNHTLAWTGQSAWRAAESNDDVYPSIALGPGPGQLLVAYAGTFSVYEGSPRPSCTWGSLLPDTYIAHCCDDGCIPHASADEAKAACSALLACYGITSDPSTGTWTLRASSSSGPSPTSESSFLIANAAACHQE